MRMTELFLAELEREAPITRRTLERVPDSNPDWKPHDKSMSMSRLATLVAIMLSWVDLTIHQDSLDLNPPGGSGHRPPDLRTSGELVKAFDDHVDRAREALRNTTDEHLMTTWKLLYGGRVVSEQPRYIVLRDAVFNHLAHHRGQLTVYLRLNNVSVPPIYGPTADEGRFE
jgi:uncharacterized damage-inducible protein DinB